MVCFYHSAGYIIAYSVVHVQDAMTNTTDAVAKAFISEAGAELASPRVSVTAAPKEPTSPLLLLTPDNVQLSEQEQENRERPSHAAGEGRSRQDDDDGRHRRHPADSGRAAGSGAFRRLRL
mgnify:CR=1 FL=1